GFSAVLLGGVEYERVRLPGLETPDEPPPVLWSDPPRVPLGSRGRLRLRRADRLIVPRRLLQPGKRRGEVRQPAGAQEASARGRGQERHLRLLLRRAEPRRYVRLQAQALPAGREDDPGEDVRPRRAQERGPGRRAQVAVQTVRQVWEIGQRPVPAHRLVRRR